MMYRNILPNFWFSLEYFKKANLEIKYEQGWVWLEDDSRVVFPPIYLWNEGIYNVNEVPIEHGYWSSFHDYKIITFPNKKFLDYEYIFNPLYFKNMAGGKWKTFRKNCRKWPRNNTRNLYAKLIKNSLFQYKVNNLLEKWLINKKNEIIEDDMTIFNYFQNGENRKVLFNSYNNIVGINIWDENWKYINYRYSVTDPSEPFVSEYLRWLFYTDPEIVNKNKLVNDGGTLGNENLKKFKNKMNPVQINKIYTCY